MKSSVRPELILFLVAFSAAFLSVPPSPAQAEMSISVDATNKQQRFDRSILGVNLRFPKYESLLNKSGSQVSTNLYAICRDLGLGLIVYPAGAYNTYHWREAIGSQSCRGSGLDDLPLNLFYSYRFGPDEFGDLLEQIGAKGITVANFGTGSAKEAAAWVAYMNATTSSTHYIGVDEMGRDWGWARDWAGLRASYGHDRPYRILTWNVGCEMWGNWPRSWSCDCWNNHPELECFHVCWTNASLPHCRELERWNYDAYFDTTTKDYEFRPMNTNLRETAVQPTDWYITGAETSGTTGEVFFVRYPPVMTNNPTSPEEPPIRLWVGDEEWNYCASGSTSVPPAFAVDHPSSEIVLIDAPPADEIVTVQYFSGPHTGLRQFVDEMTHVDASISVGGTCSTIQKPHLPQLRDAGATTLSLPHYYYTPLETTNVASQHRCLMSTV